LRERTAALAVTHPERDQYLRWTIHGSGPLLRRLRHGTLAADLLGTLREQFGRARPAVWTESLRVRAADVVGATIEEDTLLGAYLRELRGYSWDGERALDLRAYLPEGRAPDPLGDAAWPSDETTRGAILAEAAALGIDLLSEPEELP
jgi:hypothetical protein